MFEIETCLHESFQETYIFWEQRFWISSLPHVWNRDMFAWKLSRNLHFFNTDFHINSEYYLFYHYSMNKHENFPMECTQLGIEMIISMTVFDVH